MAGKLALLLKSKLAVAIFGAVLIASAGSAAALAASGGAIQTPFTAPTSSQHGDGQHHDGQRNDQGNNENDNNEAEGKITSLDAGNSSFALTDEHGASVTVTVNAQTVFDGNIKSVADLKTGMFVEVEGNAPSNGTLTATRVHGEDESADDDHNDDHGDDHGASGTSGSGGSGSGGHDDGVPHD